MTFPSHIVYSTREINLNVGYGKKFGHRFKWYCKMETREKFCANSFDQMLRKKLSIASLMHFVKTCNASHNSADRNARFITIETTKIL